MLLGFALGIANIFTFNVVIIIFCALLLYVPPTTSKPSRPSPFLSLDPRA